MPSMTDTFTAIRKMGPLSFVKRVWQEVNDDDLFTRASALAYAWLFAIFPFVLFLLSMIPLMPDGMKTKVKHQTAVLIYNGLEKSAADAIWENVWPRIDKLLLTPVKSLIGIGVILTLWGASGGINATMAALDRCYDVQKSRPIYKQRPLAIGLTVCVATMAVGVMILMPLGSLLTSLATRYSDRLIAWMGIKLSTGFVLLLVWDVARQLLALLLMFAVLAILYHFGPNLRRRFRFFTPGAVFSVVMWISLGYAFNYYVANFGKYSETYGSVAGVAILLLIFYLDALILLIGAEINAEIDAAVHGASLGRIESGDAIDQAPDSEDAPQPYRSSTAESRPVSDEA